ncbi:putative DNA mismatch repair protein-like protein MutS [Seiridium cardinale]|uniref:DNA mismatch repair protein-like protein MutS n=1 Tax=Seiridium cardinale TaxID=138064 RepID=A0ABR2XJX0_9PEZI
MSASNPPIRPQVRSSTAQNHGHSLMPPPPLPAQRPGTSRSAGLGRLPTLASATTTRTSFGTPYPGASRSRLQSSVSQHARQSLGSQSVTSSSYPSGQRGIASTASGRKSRATSSIWGSDGHQVICAVSEARGVSPSVGLAFVNITTNEAILCQICDSQFYVKTLHKIQVYDPITILMVNTTFPPNPKSNLLSVIEEEFRGTNIEPLDRKYWSETAGLELIHTLAFREDLESIKVAIQGNFYTTCSFAAVIKYMELVYHLTVMSHSLRIRYQPSENTMLIDISTIHSLELIQNIQETKSRHCLFGILNETLTPMGTRMLRSNILQPSTQVEHTLSPRFDALDELAIKEHMFYEIRTVLRDFSDLVIIPQKTAIYDSELAINHVLMIKSFVAAIFPLRDALGSARSDLLQRIRKVCRPEVIEPIGNLISNVINEDVSYVQSPIDLRHQRTYAVKTGVHGMLDVARQTYKEGVDDVHDHINKLNSDLEMAFDVRYDDNRKYYMRISDCDIEGRKLPDIIINQVKRNGYLECQTLGLVQLNNRITDSHNETVMLSDKVIHELLDAIRRQVASLFRVCEGIALLDMLAAFGQSITSRDYIRPEFGDTLALKAARHPIHEIMMQGRFVPNDVYASEEHRFQAITGCNMSGKSTYIRMISLLQVMAQIGCFVPAEYAHFPVIHQLFVRMSTDDSIEANLSTFSIEMREMAFILRNVNGKSLVIVDELGRGTSTRDGLAIALAISEALIQSNCLAWFATHFQKLAKVLGSRPGVLNLRLDTDISHGEDGEVPKMTMLYKISSGLVKEENYGISLARVVGFPDTFIHVAEAVSTALQRQTKQNKHNSRHQRLKHRRQLILNLYETFKQMDGGDMDDAALGSYLKKLQNEFALRMDTIECGHVAGAADVDGSEFGMSNMIEGFDEDTE